MQTTTAGNAMKMHPRKALLWLCTVSIVMIFAGLTSAMIVSRRPEWFRFGFPVMMWVNTAVLLLSSITMNLALRSAGAGRLKRVKEAVAATLILGLAFTLGQFVVWSELVGAGVFLVSTNTSGSYLYVLTGLHLAHLVAGLAVLAVTLVNAVKERYGPGKTLGLELSAIYWHFLDGLWLYLFLFLLFMR